MRELFERIPKPLLYAVPMVGGTVLLFILMISLDPVERERHDCEVHFRTGGSSTLYNCQSADRKEP